MELTKENVRKLVDEEFATGKHLWKYYAMDVVAKRYGWNETTTNGYYYMKKRTKILPQKMDIKINEFYVMYQALKSRQQYIIDDYEANQEELPFIKSLLDKMELLNIPINIIEEKIGGENEKIA